MEEPISTEDILFHVAYNVFLPPKLPQRALDDVDARLVNHRLVQLTLEAVELYQRHLPTSERWNPIPRMLAALAEMTTGPLKTSALTKYLKEMKNDDVLAIPIRAQNSAVIVRRSSATTTFEIFEVQAPNEIVMSTAGKIVRHFPGPAIQVPNDIAAYPCFIDEVSNFLCHMDVDVLDDALPKTVKRGVEVVETRDVVDPMYISQLFTGILRGLGREIEPRRVLKRIADEVLWDNADLPWRRSPVWLIVRVALQTSIEFAREYKNFMVFFHAHLLNICCNSTFSSDLLAVMRNKLARRILKAQHSVPEFVVNETKAVTERVEALLQVRWSTIKPQVAKFPLPVLDIEAAKTQTLPNSRDYLEKVLKGRSSKSKVSPYSPNHTPRLPCEPDFSKFADDALTKAFEESKHLALFDFECAVHRWLSVWVNKNLTSDTTTACEIIFSCLKQYQSAALAQYQYDAADKSIMILTIMELWVSLDHLATFQHKLLLDYSPEIPDDLVESLLLRTGLLIERANEVQAYIRRRNEYARFGSVFKQRFDKNSLAVRFFGQSPSLQSLKKEIEEAARLQRSAKIVELNNLNNDHAELGRRISENSCTCDAYARSLPLGHWRRCSTCKMDYKRDNMKIELHEWPLSSIQQEAEATVFELRCPQGIHLWRSATYNILCNLGGSSRSEKPEYHRTLADYQGLSEWSTQLQSHPRITVASEIKSFFNSHYSSTQIPATEDEVCVPNGMTLRLFDTMDESWADGPFRDTNFANYGTFSLPAKSPYRYLQFALRGTLHTSNQILADQFDCPKDINLLEHYQFGTLRSGGRIQWMNVVRELEANVLTFSREEVGLLLTQAAWQIGVLSDDNASREWHLSLEDPVFGARLILETNRVLDRVETNWLEMVTVEAMIMIAARLLSSTIDSSVQKDAYIFLRRARRTTFEWMKRLEEKLQDAKDDSQILDYRQRVCEAAAICRSTYDVDDFHLSKLLEDQSDFNVLIMCSVTLYNNQPPKLDKAPEHLQRLMCRDRRLAFKALPIITERLRSDSHLLDEPVSRIWAMYCCSNDGWTELPVPNSRVFVTSTAKKSGVSPQSVHMDLLEGKLLVDGKPLGRLPRDYVEHPTYSRLFGQKVLDVGPADSPGMIFATIVRIGEDEFKVSFGMDEGNGDKELIIQVERGDIIFELIPYHRLAKDFSSSILAGFHHWLDITNKILEFRALSEPWVSSEKNWHLPISTCVMEKVTSDGATILLDIHSAAFKSISRQLASLELPQYLLITLSNADNQTSISIPRMSLDFFVNSEQQIESRNFRGQIVDEDQSTGTMLGLRDQLVLRAKDPIARSLPRSRQVLIPHGFITFNYRDDQTMVQIDRGSKHHVRFHLFLVDTDMRYLANSNADLTSRLYKIYLHALTSYCLPDPLTGMTGTEMALYELTEAATSSFEQLSREQADLLKLIGALTPQRVFYPAHLKVMQTTTWANLPSLAQHYAFFTLTSAIIERADSLQLFSPANFKFDQYKEKREKLLLIRAEKRTRMLYPTETGIRVASNPNLAVTDTWYDSRDHCSDGWTEEGRLASWASRLVHERWGKTTYTNIDLISKFEESNKVVRGPASNLKLAFSSDWLRLDFSSHWLSIYNLFRQAKDYGNVYRLSFCLGATAFSKSFPLDLIPALLSIAENPSLTSFEPPEYASYESAHGYEPTVDRLRKHISESCRGIEDTPSNKIAIQLGESRDDWNWRKTRHYYSNTSTLESQWAMFLRKKWPDKPTVPSHDYHTWFNVSDCLESVQFHFESCSHNIELREHLRQVQERLYSGPILSCPSAGNAETALLKPLSPKPLTHSMGALSLLQLLQQRGFPTLTSAPTTPPFYETPGTELAPNTDQLRSYLGMLNGNTKSLIHRRFKEDLEKSWEALASTKCVSSTPLPDLQLALENRDFFHRRLESLEEEITRWLGPEHDVENVGLTSGIWPRLLPRTILGMLALKARDQVPPGILLEIQKYGRTYLEYQRSQRLLSLVLEEKLEEFNKELHHVTTGNYEEENNPDWLLTQIDGNFSIRKLQARVAREMIAPSSGNNAVLQLNMGEGKSSVIVPIIAAALANAEKLVRVIVLKPLWRQMFHLLVARLSGLVNRRIYYLPFGRHIQTDESKARQIRSLYKECMDEGGVLLVQPEHILSFKLMGIDQLLFPSEPSVLATAEHLKDTEKWLSVNSRDILDESDEILHVRYQLVYTMGEQQALEGHQKRWTTIQQVLRLAANCIDTISRNYPSHFKYKHRKNGQFPFIRIMPNFNKGVSEFTRSVGEMIGNSGIESVRFHLLPAETREVALQFLVNKEIDTSCVKALGGLDPSTRNDLLLLRGLLACGIITFALRDKHHRVDYGLDLSRSVLAVPYRAKDMPSVRAEFGHPDVAIVLTYLSYYDTGLTHDQLDTCFELLYKLDNPELEYEQWVKCNSTIPEDFRRLSNINVKDRDQFVDKLVPLFAHNSAAINFFLSSIVFPREAKQFPHKLSTSGWDLAERKNHVTTGFSGTNDNRYLLPVSIAQEDLEEQKPTNALVLTYLLQPENNHYMQIQGSSSGDEDWIDGFLDTLVKQDSKIHVLLDVGAQILQLSNQALVEHWMEREPDAAAGVYFNEKDELVILPRAGSPALFHSSPFSQQMDRCIIYLDEGHTRGTDLKLPTSMRAAVTLGAKVTKDRLLQGCMRMRKLGFGQSVIFCAPPEIDAQIRKTNNTVNAGDVIRWAIDQTCKDLEHHVPHWAMQGVEYNRRKVAQRKYEATDDTDDLKPGWMTAEARSLTEMYDITPSAKRSSESLVKMTDAYPDIKTRLTGLGVRGLSDPSMDEEQEREVSHEIERERHVERPPKLRAVSHSIHQDVRNFVTYGTLPLKPSGILPLFTPLKDSGLPPEIWSPTLMATRDFCKTVETVVVTNLSDYMRPVHWILSGLNNDLVVISPYEANQMLHEIQNSDFVRLHVFAPRTIQSMLSFSDLRFYSPPATSGLSSSLIDPLVLLQLDLFAGQLYFDDYARYRIMCGFLGIFLGDDANGDRDGVLVQSDGFLEEPSRHKLIHRIREYVYCKFPTSPVSALQDLMSYRRKGMDYSRTHVGRMLSAFTLQQNDKSFGK
ncbi:kinase-like protein [Ceratobasidium sp. AG-Ba]|nr:kinase-like protein [Ceratobasidium sp. AG-Ba]